jgi:hypothetical protein
VGRTVNPEHLSWSTVSLSRLSVGCCWSCCFPGVDEPTEGIEEDDKLEGSLGGPTGSDARGPELGAGEPEGEGTCEGGPRQLPRLRRRRL